MQRHARNNAQAAIVMAKKKAQDFDTQAALERKTNEAIKLAKRQAHIRADEDVDTGAPSTGLVDRTCHSHKLRPFTKVWASRLRRAKLPESYVAHRRAYHCSAKNAHGDLEGVPAEGPQLACDSVRAGYQWYPGR